MNWSEVLECQELVNDEVKNHLSWTCKSSGMNIYLQVDQMHIFMWNMIVAIVGSPSRAESFNICT